MSEAFSCLSLSFFVKETQRKTHPEGLLVVPRGEERRRAEARGEAAPPLLLLRFFPTLVLLRRRRKRHHLSSQLLAQRRARLERRLQELLELFLPHAFVLGELAERPALPGGSPAERRLGLGDDERGGGGERG